MATLNCWRCVMGRLVAVGAVAALSVGIARAQNTAPRPADDTKAPGQAASPNSPVINSRGGNSPGGNPPGANSQGAGSHNADPQAGSPPSAQEPPPPSAGAANSGGSNSSSTTRNDENKRSGVGLQFEEKSGQLLRVSNVDSNSAAAQAGIRSGDRVIAIDGRPFSSGRQAEVYLGAQAGRPVPVAIERAGRQMVVQVLAPEPQGDSAWIGVLLEEAQQIQGTTRPTAPTPLTPDRAGERPIGGVRKGARISQVFPAGPAARAGLRGGDVVTQINGKQIEGPGDLIVAVHEMQPRAKADVVVLRDAQEVKIPVTVGSRQDFMVQRQFGPAGGEPQLGRGAGGEDFGPFNPQGMQPDARRMAEQHQRLEQEVRQLREEVSRLRDQVQRMNAPKQP